MGRQMNRAQWSRYKPGASGAGLAAFLRGDVFLGAGCSSARGARRRQHRPTGEPVKLLAEATLALVLFADAALIDLRALRRENAVPLRLLGIGLPLTIVAGRSSPRSRSSARSSWPRRSSSRSCSRPTDAALGQAVVTEPRLPSRIRQGLNVESGLNDGICVPLLFIVLAVAEAEADDAERRTRVPARRRGDRLRRRSAARSRACSAAAVSCVAARRGLIDGAWLQVVPVAGAALAYGLAAPLGGCGFIAAFVAGIVFGGCVGRERGTIDHLIDELGERARTA